MPTILTKKSDTPGAVPATANLTNAAGGAELAVNTADKRLFALNSSSAVVEIGTNPGSLTTAEASATVFRSGSATITNLIATTATVSDLSATVGRIGSGTITNLIATSGAITNLVSSDLSATVSRSASATITNLLATSLTVSSGSTLNGGVVINELGADADTRIEGDTDANLFFVDASTDNVGIGTASPAVKLEVLRGSEGEYLRAGGDDTGNNGRGLRFTSSTNGGFIGAKHTLNAPSAGGAIAFATTSTERAVIDSSGNLGLGVTPVASFAGYKTFQIASQGYISSDSTSNGELEINNNAYRAPTTAALTYINSFAATKYAQYQGQHRWFTAPSGTAGNTITFTQAMTLDASGNLGVGATSPSATFRATVQGVGTSGNPMGGILFRQGATDVFSISPISTDNTTDVEFWNYQNGYMRFVTNNTERARITSGGEFLVGKTTASLATAGVSIEANGTTAITRSSGGPLIVNRNTDDGTLVSLRQDQNEEGSISVSGNTVSYNAFAGSHWSQLQDGSKPDILRGTVMESINELCEWPGEQNERLPKSKISDTAGSKKVYGVFMAWDNDWTATNDMYVTAVGAFICRVNGSVTVQEGDLLESNGDGTARVQADDIIRSSTIGKVTSTVKTHEYDDGSYCVPTVLYCG